jgi:hypothetical protein
VRPAPHFLVAARVEVILHFLLLAGKIPIAVAQLLLGPRALVFGHGRAVFLQLVFLRLQRLLLVLQVALPRSEFRANGLDDSLRLGRLLHELAVVDDADLQVGGPCRQDGKGARYGNDPGQGMGADQALHGNTYLK